jgi:hypothetical protein
VLRWRVPNRSDHSTDAVAEAHDSIRCPQTCSLPQCRSSGPGDAGETSARAFRVIYFAGKRLDFTIFEVALESVFH